MSKDYELARLKQEEQNAFSRKQEAYQRYDIARKYASSAHDHMETAWRDRTTAMEAMNQEFHARKEAYARHDAIWHEYGAIRDRNSAEIERLRAEADMEHEAMKDAFDRASNAYEYGDRSEAPYYASEGHEHKERRDELNERVRELAQEVKDAKSYAVSNAPPVDSTAFNVAKAEYDRAKEYHLAAEKVFKKYKAERDEAKAAFDYWQAEHTRLKQEYQARLAVVKAENQRERNQVLDKAGVRWSEREDAKIVKKTDGTTQVYHGGLGSGDGVGHGHTVLDGTGRKTYDRDAFSEHGSHNYADDDSNGFTMYDRRARIHTEVGGTGVENRIDVHSGIGHTTQWYKDGYRVSWDTNDGGRTQHAHWTNQNLPKNDPKRHGKPEDANT